MKNSYGNKSIYIILLLIILNFTACSTIARNTDNISGIEETQEPAMGRYLEATYNLPGEMADYSPFVKTDKGYLKAADYKNGFFVSKNEGMTWEPDEDRGFLPENYEGERFMNISLSNKNSAILSTYGESSHYYYQDSNGIEKELHLTDLNEGDYLVVFSFSQDGLYRHVLYGNTIEKIIEGSFCTIGDPRYAPVGVDILNDGSIIILFSQGLLAHYIYDEEVTAVPQKELYIYSLEENDVIKQAVTIYQKEHKNIYVKYESDFNDYQGQNPMTREDAVKKLNQRLMSGNSPDILLLDGLPVDSYIEKGILKNLTDTLSNFYLKYPQEQLFDNIVEGIQSHRAIYVIPIQFRLPVIVGEQDIIADIRDLNSFAVQMKKLRDKYPQRRILCVTEEEQFLRLFGMICVSSWQDERGNLDKNSLIDFYTQVNRIYQAELKGITQEDVDIYHDYIVNSGYSEEADLYYLKNANNCSDILVNESKISLGYTEDIIVDYTDICGLLHIQEDYGVKEWNGQEDRIFLPNTLFGICTKSEESELSEDFLHFILTETVQELGTDNGFPVNKWDTEYISSFYYIGQKGEEIEFPLYWPNEQQKI